MAAAAGLRPQTPSVQTAIAARQNLEQASAATTLQGVRRKSLAKERVAKLKSNEDRRRDASSKLNSATAAATAALEGCAKRTEEPDFPRVLDAATAAVRLLEAVLVEAEAPACAAAAPAAAVPEAVPAPV